MEGGMSEQGYEDANRAESSYDADVNAGFADEDDRDSSDAAAAGSVGGSAGGTQTSQDADVDAAYDDRSDSPTDGATSDS